MAAHAGREKAPPVVSANYEIGPRSLEKIAASCDVNKDMTRFHAPDVSNLHWMEDEAAGGHFSNPWWTFWSWIIGVKVIILIYGAATVFTAACRAGSDLLQQKMSKLLSLCPCFVLFMVPPIDPTENPTRVFIECHDCCSLRGEMLEAGWKTGTEWLSIPVYG